MPPRMKFLVALMTYTVAMRVIPYLLTTYDFQVNKSAIFYPWNFMPLMAVCLFSGASISDRRWKFGLPMLTLFVSDLAIWGITGIFEWGFPSDRWSAYLCYPIAIVIGQGLYRNQGLARTFDALGRGLAAEAVFFIVTNFAYFLVQDVHPHTFAGLLTSYEMAIPFVTKSLLATGIFTVLLFSPLTNRVPSLSRATEPKELCSMRCE